MAILTLALACSDPARPDTTAFPGEWLSLGLRDRAVRCLAILGSHLYAGTDNGVYRASLGSSAPEWIALGPASRTIDAVLVLSPDTVLTATALTGTGADTVALFRTTDGGLTWQPYQNGFGGESEAKRVLALAKLTGDSSALLASGAAAVVAKSINADSNWRVVWGGWQLGAVGMHFIAVDARCLGSVWVGGEGGFFQPLLLHSEDFGETWHEIRINAVGDNAHYSLAIDPANSDVVFTGMEGRVAKSADGGQTWESVLQPGDYPYFYGLGSSRAYPRRVYGAGAGQGLATDLRELRLYVTNDAGASWQSSAADSVRGGVRGLLLWSSPASGERVLLATGEGIWQFTPAQ
jgi:photosystem II stability/assembly factor-like uncharacterized protein